MKSNIFTGTATALITPFTDDLKDVDYQGFEKLLTHQLNNNIDALVVCGTTGEAPTLTDTERNNLFERTVSFCKNKIPVIAGTGSNNTTEAIRKSNEAEKKGVDALLLVTPFYNKCTQQGLIKHYFTIADNVSIPVIIYNVPSRTGVNISPETYLALSAHPNICGVKEADPDISKFTKSISLCKDKLVFYSGNDDLTIAMMAYGADGVISVSSNIIPDAMRKITDNMLSGNYDIALKTYLQYSEYISSMFCEVNPIPVKYSASKHFGFSEKLRCPLTVLSETNKILLDNISVNI